MAECEEQTMPVNSDPVKTSPKDSNQTDEEPECLAPPQLSFAMLPTGEGRTRSFVTSSIANGIILLLVLSLGVLIKPKLVKHVYEQTALLLPEKPVEKPKVKVEPVKLPEPPKPVEVKLEAPKINLPRIEPKPEKPIQMEAKIPAPTIREAKPAVILAPQPKSALAAAAAPAQVPQAHPSTAPVHLGETFGVTPNPNAKGPATIASIGNPWGGMKGPSVAPRGVVGSTGFGDGVRAGSNAGIVGKVASAAVPASGPAVAASAQGKVASAGIPAAMTVAVAVPKINATPTATALEVLSKPAVQYTAEARELKVQGDVILRVTFTARGQVQVEGILHGLGHGLDEEARRVAQQIRFRPATRNGQAVDLTTNITITFQLA
jgi:TonB family protein